MLAQEGGKRAPALTQRPNTLLLAESCDIRQGFKAGLGSCPNSASSLYWAKARLSLLSLGWAGCGRDRYSPPVGSTLMGSKEVEGLGPDELLVLLLLLLLLSSRAEDCSGRVSSAVGPSGSELSSPLSLLSVPEPPLTETTFPKLSHTGGAGQGGRNWLG